jgi:hypothetical protein
MEELGLTSGTISVRIDRLVAGALVERAADPASRRNTLITLTARGRELFERVVPAHLENERRLLTALTRDEEEQLAALLRKLLVEFEGVGPPPGTPPRLGRMLAPAHVTIAMRRAVGLPPTPGLLVRAVDDDGPAAAAGIRTGDVLTHAARRVLRSVAVLEGALDDAGAGDLQITLLRGTDEHRLTVELPGRRWRHVAATSHRPAIGTHRV